MGDYQCGGSQLQMVAASRTHGQLFGENSDKFRFTTEVYLPILYYGELVDVGYRIDILIESEVIIEIKSVQNIANIHKAQLLTYLKLARKKVGLLINFNVEHLKDGINRFIL